MSARLISAVSIPLVAAVLAMGASAHGATYTWQLTVGGYWGTPNNWSDGTDNGVPGSGDSAYITPSSESQVNITLNANATVGSLYTAARYGTLTHFKASTSGLTFTFDNNGSPSIVENGSRHGGSEGLVRFGTDTIALTVALANDLIVRNNTATDDLISDTSKGRFHIGANATLTGGSLASRRTITTQSVGTDSNNAILFTMQGSATFIGDWVVDGSRATLRMASDGFGHASNTVTLKNGGTLDLDSFDSGYSLTRRVSGEGKILAAHGLTLAAGGVLSPGQSKGTIQITTSTLALTDGTLEIDLLANNDSDLIAVTGAAILGGTLDLTTLDGYVPALGDSWTILTATEGITGSFSSLPPGFTTSIVEGETHSLVLSYVPEPGMVLPALLGLAAIRRRRIV